MVSLWKSMTGFLRSFASICVYAHGLFLVSVSIRVSFHFLFPCFPMFCRRRTSFETYYQPQSGDGRHRVPQPSWRTVIRSVLSTPRLRNCHGGEEWKLRLQSLSQVPTQRPQSPAAFHVIQWSSVQQPKTDSNSYSVKRNVLSFLQKRNKTLSLSECTHEDCTTGWALILIYERYLTHH